MKTLILSVISITLGVMSLGQTATEPGSGNCLDFDGGTNYVQVANNASLQFGTGDCSIEAWVYWDTPQRGSVVAKGTTYWGSTYSPNYEIEITNTGAVCAYFDGGSFSTYSGYCTPAGAVQLNGWHHIVVQKVVAIDKHVFYVDGEFVDQGVYPGRTLVGQNTNTSDPLYIGCVQHTSGRIQHFPGKIDEVRVWDHALSQTEIRDSMCKKLTGNETGLVGYWRMDEGADGSCTGGQDACDASGNGNHGTKF